MDAIYDFLKKLKVWAGRTVALVLALVVLAVLIWAWFFAGKDEFTITNYPPDGGTVVAFGDSLVRGTGARGDQGFVSILGERIGTKIINLGVPGDTTADGLARIDSVLAYEPDIVLVLFGGNDVLRREEHETTFNNLHEIVRILQEHGAVVILLGVQSGVFFDDFSSGFEMLSHTMGALLVPNVLDGWFNQPSLKFDQVHPNDAGYIVLANKVEPVLRAVYFREY